MYNSYPDLQIIIHKQHCQLINMHPHFFFTMLSPVQLQQSSKAGQMQDFHRLLCGFVLWQLVPICRHASSTLEQLCQQYRRTANSGLLVQHCQLELSTSSTDMQLLSLSKNAADKHLGPAPQRLSTSGPRWMLHAWCQAYAKTLFQELFFLGFCQRILH